MYGWMDGYQYIYCLPPAGGRIRSQGNKMRRLRRRPREGCGFSSLMKQNKKAKNYAVFCFAGKKKLLFYIYAVIVKQFFLKRSTNHYSWCCVFACKSAKSVALRLSQDSVAVEQEAGFLR
jgi:hypothetical protein